MMSRSSCSYLTGESHLWQAVYPTRNHVGYENQPIFNSNEWHTENVVKKREENSWLSCFSNSICFQCSIAWPFALNCHWKKWFWISWENLVGVATDHSYARDKWFVCIFCLTLVCACVCMALPIFWNEPTRQGRELRANERCLRRCRCWMCADYKCCNC